MSSEHNTLCAEEGNSSLVTLTASTPANDEKFQALDLAMVSVLLEMKKQTSAAPLPINQKPESTEKPAECQIVPKPKAKFAPASRWIRFQLWFNTYRKFFTFIIIFQLAGMIAAGLGHFPYANENTAGFVIGNMLAGVVVRNELFGRLLYLIINACFAKWSPLWFRLALSSILQHLGGIHSGCSVSAVGWLVFNLVNLFRDRENIAPGVLAMGVIVLTTIVFVCISAAPWVRNTHHNVFERNHRFIGWTGIVVTWIYIILENGYRRSRSTFTANSYTFAHRQELWLTLFMAIAVLLPWTYTRKVPISVELPSSKVAVIRFERGMQQGLIGRISRTAVLEYHAFGIISEGTHAKYHYMVCGVQGDFTRGLVNDMPTHIWTREVKFAAIGNTSTLYRRGIRICTGTGIGAALSTCLQSDQWFLIWIGELYSRSDVLKTFGPTVAELIERGVGDRAILWDTKKLGRPKTMELLAETYQKWNAEVVMITSNWDGNQEMMQGCMQRGIPAFGTLWDF